MGTGTGPLPLLLQGKSFPRKLIDTRHPLSPRKIPKPNTQFAELQTLQLWLKPPFFLLIVANFAKATGIASVSNKLPGG
jgi:hypothetical protein